MITVKNYLKIIAEYLLLSLKELFKIHSILKMEP